MFFKTQFIGLFSSQSGVCCGCHNYCEDIYGGEGGVQAVVFGYEARHYGVKQYA